MKKFLALFLSCLLLFSLVGCNNDDNNDNSNTGCSHSYSITNSVSATCNTYSSTTYTCDLCGHSYVETGTEYGEHDYQVHSSTQGTCQTKSSTTNKCSTCGDTNTTYGNYGNHSGVKTCTTCSNSFYTLLKNYIVSNGVKSSSGSFGVLLKGSPKVTVTLIYTPNTSYISCSGKTTLGFTSLTINSGLTYEWGYLDINDYFLYGYLTPSTYRSSSSITSYTNTNCPSYYLPIALGEMEDTMDVIFDSLSSKVTNSTMGFTLYNLGFTSYS